MNTVDRVAKAICEAHTGDIEAWDITYDGGRDTYRRMAQAAIDALDLTQLWSVDLGPGEGYSEDVWPTSDCARDEAAEAVSSGYPGAHVVTYSCTPRVAWVGEQ